MESLEEINHFVSQLGGAERRFITLLGKARAGAGGSQHLQLFEWLKKQPNAGSLPRALHAQLPTLSQRLKSLILDSLRLLDKGPSDHAKLLVELHTLQLLHQKGIYTSAQRQLQRTESLAAEACRWDLVLQCCAFARKIELEKGTAKLVQALNEISLREQDAAAKLNALLILRQQHDKLLSLSRKSMDARNSPFQQAITRIKTELPLNQIWKNGNWLERALAGNLLGIIDLFEKKHKTALLRYRQLLTEWNAKQAWQLDESSLYLNLCKNFQNACFLQPQSNDEMSENLSLLSDVTHLPASQAFEKQHLIYRERIVLILTKPNFDWLKDTRPEIVKWILSEETRLGTVRAVGLLFNLAVAEFLHENYSEANRLVLMILRMDTKNSREDILNFCRVFQAILQYELKNAELNEYLIRSARRHFSKKSFEDQFELSVLHCLSQITSLNPKAGNERQKAWTNLEKELESIAAKLAATNQIVGLMETLLWVRSKHSGKSLSKVYTEELYK